MSRATGRRVGYFCNELVLNLTPIVTAATPWLLVLILLTGLAHDSMNGRSTAEVAPGMGRKG